LRYVQSPREDLFLCEAGNMLVYWYAAIAYLPLEYQPSLSSARPETFS